MIASEPEVNRMIEELDSKISMVCNRLVGLEEGQGAEARRRRRRRRLRRCFLLRHLRLRRVVVGRPDGPGVLH